MKTSPDSQPVILEIRGIGHVPSFKNKKRIGRGGCLFTEPKVKNWMDRAIRDLRSQLLSGFRTTEGATSTVRSTPSLIALCEHCEAFDDSWQWIPSIAVAVEFVPKGQEGALIEITVVET